MLLAGAVRMLESLFARARVTRFLKLESAAARMRFRQGCLTVAVCSGLGLAPPALAEDAPARRALLLETADHSDRIVRDLDKRLHDAVVATAPVQLVESPHKKLSGLQTGASCHDQSAACLRELTQRAGVDVLIVPSLERGNEDLVLTLRAFDSAGEGKLREVAHWQDGKKPTPETLDSLPELVRGLFQLQPAAQPVEIIAPPTAARLEGAPAQTSVAASDAQPLRLAPWILIGAGAVVLGAGAISGGLMLSSEHDYKKTTVSTREEAREARDVLSRANTEGTVAEVCIALGGLAVVAGGGWLLTEWWLGQHRDAAASTRLAPVLTPREIGFVLQYQGGPF
jgi:hypothetical protein